MIADGECAFDLFLVVKRWLGRIDQRVIQRTRQTVVLCFYVIASDRFRHARHVKDFREIKPARLPVIDARLHIEPIAVAD